MISRQLREALLAKHAPRTRIAKAFHLTENFQRGDLNDVFEEGTVLESTAVFVDICGSARVTAKLDPAAVQAYLNEFYDAVIPEIYGFGGEIDKLIGDGIVAVFGPPFMKDVKDVKDGGLKAGMTFAKKVVRDLAYTHVAVKCAIRRGPLCFTTIGNSNYRELTMVGNTLAELHRLEGVAQDRAVNVYAETPEHDWLVSEPASRVQPAAAERPYWHVSTNAVGDLRGVNFKGVYSEQWTDPRRPVSSLLDRLNDAFGL